MEFLSSVSLPSAAAAALSFALADAARIEGEYSGCGVFLWTSVAVSPRGEEAEEGRAGEGEGRGGRIGFIPLRLLF